MSDMLRGRVYSCGCCASKPGNPQAMRAREKELTRRLIKEQSDD